MRLHKAFFNGGSPKEYVLGRWTPENPNPNAVYPRLLESANNNQNYNDNTTSSFGYSMRIIYTY